MKKMNKKKRRSFCFELTFLEPPKWLGCLRNNVVRILPSQNFDLLPLSLIVVVQRGKNATFHTNFHK